MRSIGHAHDARPVASVGLEAHVRRHGFGGRAVEQRPDVDPRFRIGPVFVTDGKAAGPVRGDRSPVVPRHLQPETAESFVSKNLHKGP